MPRKKISYEVRGISKLSPTEIRGKCLALIGWFRATLHSKIKLQSSNYQTSSQNNFVFIIYSVVKCAYCGTKFESFGSGLSHLYCHFVITDFKLHNPHLLTTPEHLLQLSEFQSMYIFKIIYTYSLKLIKSWFLFENSTFENQPINRNCFDSLSTIKNKECWILRETVIGSEIGYIYMYKLSDKISENISDEFFFKMADLLP